MDWLLFVPQLPPTPSSLRVHVWRKLRAAGAFSLTHGVWILPREPEQERFLEELLTSIHSQGAGGYAFSVTALTDAIEHELLNRFPDYQDSDVEDSI